MFDLQSNQYSTRTYSTCTRLIKGKSRSTDNDSL